jgi:hypothetical protein
MAQAPDDAVDRLYGLPREDFIGERDALAKELRAGGRRDEATAVKALTKPTVAAWAANQAVRSQKGDARELWKAGDQLSAAHDAILAGKGSGAKLREATERERAAVERLVDAARGLLSASGADLSEATIERVRETLHAGAIDPDAREEVAGGRTARERAPQGLFGGGDVFAAPAPKRAAKAAPEPKAKPERRSTAKPKGDDADARKREREEAAARKRDEAAARKREREQAAARERELKAATERVIKARRALAAAQARSAKAADRLEQAQASEREAADALDAASADLGAVERG